ncbi:MAG: hypothetical protein L0922_00250 [Candidatus Mariimomonas ferrooxydans]
MYERTLIGFPKILILQICVKAGRKVIKNRNNPKKVLVGVSGWKVDFIFKKA